MRFLSLIIGRLPRFWNWAGGSTMSASEYQWRRDLLVGAVASTTERRLAMIWKVLIWAMLMIFVVSGAKADAHKSRLTDTPDAHLIRDDPEWERRPPHIRKWFQSLMQPDDPRTSCCGEADAYEADL